LFTKNHGFADGAKGVSIMACQPLADIPNFQARSRITKRRITETRRHIHRIEAAKALVCGIPSVEATTKLRRNFETLLPLLQEGYLMLNNGGLDAMGDEELRAVVTVMQENDAQISILFEGALRIGLAAVEPFPQLLAEIKAYQERLQSQVEGILLSLSDPFQSLVAKTAQEITIPT
jgi:hypothetical protein